MLNKWDGKYVDLYPWEANLLPSLPWDENNGSLSSTDDWKRDKNLISWDKLYFLAHMVLMQFSYGKPLLIEKKDWGFAPSSFKGCRFYGDFCLGFFFGKSETGMMWYKDKQKWICKVEQYAINFSHVLYMHEVFEGGLSKYDYGDICRLNYLR